MEHLTFSLFSPMQSWGEIAVGERRHSYSHPSKSAVIGLVAAALGLPRADESDLSERAHLDLQRSLGFAVAVVRHGGLLSDFHTTQTPPRTGKAHYSTRRDEITFLPRNKLSTILSYREYRVDALYRVCLWPTDEKTLPFALSEIRDKLLRPEFTLYCGRKSCPPALPLDPQLVQAETLKEVFVNPPSLPENLRRSLFPNQETDLAIYWEPHSNNGFEASSYQFTRRDNILSRKRWQFQDRTENLSRLTITFQHEEES